MDSGLYAAYTALLSRTQALDTAANNLANVGTTGFRAQKDYFRGVLVGNFAGGEQKSQVGDSINAYGVLGGSRADLSQGPMVPTANPLDLALSGQGFFAIQTKQGIRYTRDGSFMKSATGQLQTSAGEPVLNATKTPITLPSGTVEVSTDGTVSVETAGGTAVVDQVGVFNFANPALLTAEGASRFNAGTQATITGDATVKQGAVEGANQDAVTGTIQLVLIQRQAEMLQKALSVFDNDFDKVAVEQIARV
jgi:flagellar basal-body rod protein FlgF/flagellar basal-body rod protein FlgG